MFGLHRLTFFLLFHLHCSDSSSPPAATWILATVHNFATPYIYNTHEFSYNINLQYFDTFLTNSPEIALVCRKFHYHANMTRYRSCLRRKSIFNHSPPTNVNHRLNPKECINTFLTKLDPNGQPLSLITPEMLDLPLMSTLVSKSNSFPIYSTYVADFYDRHFGAFLDQKPTHLDNTTTFTFYDYVIGFTEIKFDIANNVIFPQTNRRTNCSILSTSCDLGDALLILDYPSGYPSVSGPKLNLTARTDLCQISDSKILCNKLRLLIEQYQPNPTTSSQRSPVKLRFTKEAQIDSDGSTFTIQTNIQTLISSITNQTQGFLQAFPLVS